MSQLTFYSRLVPRIARHSQYIQVTIDIEVYYNIIHTSMIIVCKMNILIHT